MPAAQELITKSFANQCLAFPDRVDAILAEVKTLEDAKGVLDNAAALQTYAERLKAGVEVERPIALGVLKIKAKLGELMPAEKGGRGKKTPIPDIGVLNPVTISAYRKLAANRDKLEDYYEATGEIGDVPTQTDFLKYAKTGVIKNGNGTHVANNSGENEWYTPTLYLDAVRVALGEIELDPASSRVAQKTVKAVRYFTAKSDGLSQAWEGKVFLNPPYSSDLVAKFTRKLTESFSNGDVTEAILLVNNATETAWFQECLAVATAVCFPAGRIKYLDSNGDPKNTPLQGQAFIYFGTEPETFANAFRDIGRVLGCLA